MTTTDLSKFGYRELEMAKDLLDSWLKNCLPGGFYESNISIMFNTNSGNVFLTNSSGEVAMINFDTNQLEKFYSSPYEGIEGFYNDLKKEYDNMNTEDQEWFKSINN